MQFTRVLIFDPVNAPATTPLNSTTTEGSGVVWSRTVSTSCNFKVLTIGWGEFISARKLTRSHALLGVLGVHPPDDPIVCLPCNQANIPSEYMNVSPKMRIRYSFGHLMEKIMSPWSWSIRTSRARKKSGALLNSGPHDKPENGHSRRIGFSILY